ncbi:MAG: NAD(P)/FAD-dependent oxidoreductase, partial [Spirochaetota bacterium]|nr:NAD(P)/FAD-dependent oxidoreductase [Spirochaetota bacterium]
LVNPIHRAELISHDDYSFEMVLNHPIYICSRKKLAEYLLNMAIKSNVKVVSQKVLDIMENNSTIHLATKNNNYDFDFIIGADGARSMVRRCMKGKFPSNYYAITLGYYLLGKWENKIILKFHKNLKGYTWIFPREDHVSIGIGSMVGSVTTKELKLELNNFLLKEYPNIKLSEAAYYSAFIPSLPAYYLNSLKCSGNNWALIGDAAGFADPITGEGIYYALKSAEILSKCIIQNKIEEYDFRWKKAFGNELQKSASLSSIFFNNQFTESMILMASKSKTIKNIVSDLLTGQQSYITLKDRLRSQITNCICESMIHSDFALNKRLLKNLNNIRSNLF